MWLLCFFKSSAKDLWSFAELLKQQRSHIQHQAPKVVTWRFYCLTILSYYAMYDPRNTSWFRQAVAFQFPMVFSRPYYDFNNNWIITMATVLENTPQAQELLGNGSLAGVAVTGYTDKN